MTKSKQDYIAELVKEGQTREKAELAFKYAPKAGNGKVITGSIKKYYKTKPNRKTRKKIQKLGKVASKQDKLDKIIKLLEKLV